MPRILRCSTNISVWPLPCYPPTSEKSCSRGSLVKAAAISPFISLSPCLICSPSIWNKDRQQHSHTKMHTYFSADSDHCLPFRYSLRWRALRWDVTWCCALCWWFSVSNLHLVEPMSWWWIEPMWSWCWWSCPVFLCPCVCGHLQTCYCHLGLALTSHIDCFRNVQLSPFPFDFCTTKISIIQGLWKLSQNCTLFVRCANVIQVLMQVRYGQLPNEHRLHFQSFD